MIHSKYKIQQTTSTEINLLKTQTYINVYSVLKRIGWETISNSTTTKIPLTAEPKMVWVLKTTVRNTEKTAPKESERQMTTIGKIIYIMVTCWLGISFGVKKFSKYSIAPAVCHHIVVENVFSYLFSTIVNGLIYWRTTPCKKLPIGPEPTHITFSMNGTSTLAGTSRFHHCMGL